MTEIQKITDSEETGSLLREKTGEYKETILHIAAEVGDSRILSHLCSRGADIHSQVGD